MLTFKIKHREGSNQHNKGSTSKREKYFWQYQKHTFIFVYLWNSTEAAKERSWAGICLSSWTYMKLETFRAKLQCCGKSSWMVHVMQRRSSSSGWLFQTSPSTLGFLPCSASDGTVIEANASCAAPAPVLRMMWADLRWIQVSIFAPNFVGESSLSGG